MRIVRIDHVQLAMPVGGEDAARAFYRDLLGIPETPKPPHLAVRGGCWFESPPLRVHLGVEANFVPARKAHPALIVEGLGELVALLRARGHSFEEEPTSTGDPRIYTEDPFGNRLELIGRP